MEANLGLKFNKLVYENIHNPDDFKEDCGDLIDFVRNLKLDDLNPNQLNAESKFPKGVVQSFVLKTAGQGLLIGIGNDHGTKQTENEFKMGFHFDHSTGIPVITGHSLKGRLRSFFPIAYKGEKNNSKNKFITERIKLDIKEALGIEKEFNNDELHQLEQAIFEGNIVKSQNGKEKLESIPLAKRDVFIGAFPSKSNHPSYTYSIPDKRNKQNRNGKDILRNNLPVVEIYEKNKPVQAGTFLFDDNFAQHKHPLKDPVPLRLLKIINKIEIKFQFVLNDSGGLKKDEKKELFCFLLRKYGAGAKTSSGYGQFEKEIPKNFLQQSGFLLINKTSFKPIIIEAEDKSEISLKKNIPFNDNNTDKIKDEQKIRADLNKEFKVQRKENIKKLNAIIEINKPYVGKVIKILLESDMYRINLRELDITLNRKIFKEAKKGIKIALNQEYIIVFSTIKEPLQFTVSEKQY